MANSWQSWISWPLLDLPALLVGFALAVVWDLLLGEPPNRFHPVVWMGAAVARVKPRLVTGSLRAQIFKGTLLALLLPAFSATLVLASLYWLRDWYWLQVLVAGFWIKSAFSLGGLSQAARGVSVPLASGELPLARSGLRSLCSRDPSGLDERQLVAGTLESISENTSDSVVAPMLYLMLFGPAGMVFYRAVNTLDAMVGYRGQFEYGGKASARLDDALNLVPARLTAVLLLASGAIQGQRPVRGLRVACRDARKTASPNAGYPMAAFAGLLGVELEKPGHYVLGDRQRELSWRLIAEGLRVVLGAGALMIVIVLGVLWWQS